MCSNNLLECVPFRPATRNLNVNPMHATSLCTQGRHTPQVSNAQCYGNLVISIHQIQLAPNKVLCICCRISAIPGEWSKSFCSTSLRGLNLEKTKFSWCLSRFVKKCLIPETTPGIHLTLRYHLLHQTLVYLHTLSFYSVRLKTYGACTLKKLKLHFF